MITKEEFIRLLVEHDNLKVNELTEDDYGDYAENVNYYMKRDQKFWPKLILEHLNGTT